MIEESKARNGQPILKINGRLLGSAVDPSREARGWVQKRQNTIDGVSTVVILGLGCGYHIEELKKQAPNLNIVVIEKERECIEFFKKQFPLEYPSINLIHIDESINFIDSEDYKKIVSSHYVVLKNEASMATHSEDYNLIENYLLGRDSTSLLHLLSLRNDFDFISDLNNNQKKLKLVKEQCLTIKDLNQMIGDEPSPTSPYMVIRALRELVI